MLKPESPSCFTQNLPFSKLNSHVVWGICILFLCAASSCRLTRPKTLPLSTEELIAYGAQLKYAFDTEDVEFFERCSDSYRVLGRMIENGLIEEPSEEFGRNFNKEYSVLSYFFAEVGGEKWDYIHVKGPIDHEGEELLRVRLSDANLRYIYYDILFEKRTYEGDTSTILVDIHFPLLGQWMSGITKELIDQESEEGVAFSEKYLEMIQAFNTRDYERGMEIYRTMPQKQQDRKTVLLSRYLAALEVSDSLAAESRNRYQELYPGDVRLVVNDMDKYFLEGNYPAFLEAVVQMEEIIDNEDAVFLTYKGIGETLLGNMENAEKWFNLAIDLEPNFYHTYLQSMDGMIVRGDFEGAVKRGKQLEAIGYGPEMFDWEQRAEFTASEEYFEWVGEAGKDEIE